MRANTSLRACAGRRHLKTHICPYGHDMTSHPPQPDAATWHQRLFGLAALLPLFKKPDAEPAIRALNDVAYRLDWVLVFDWPKCAHGPECQRLIQNPREIAAVDVLTLARLLTSFLRQDRFCEGSLKSAFEHGQLLAIVRRASVLSQEAEER